MTVILMLTNYFLPCASYRKLSDKTINGEDLAYTVVGRATGTSQIVGMARVCEISRTTAYKYKSLLEA